MPKRTGSPPPPHHGLYRGRSSDERRLDRRERLLQAGLQIFGSRGYAQASISGLCRAAAVTTRHFYEEFASREALLIAVYDDSIQRLLGAFSGALASAGEDLMERVRAGVGALARAALADPRRVRILTVEVIGAGPEVEHHRLEVERGFVRLLAREAARLAAAGLVPRRDYSLSAVAVVGAVSGLMTHWATQPKPPPVSSLLDEVVRMTIGVCMTQLPSDAGAAG